MERKIFFWAVIIGLFVCAGLIQAREPVSMQGGGDDCGSSYTMLGVPGGDFFPNHDPDYTIIALTQNNYLEGQAFPNGYYIKYPSFNCDGTRIVVSARTRISGVLQPYELWIMDYDAPTQTLSNFSQITFTGGTGDIADNIMCSWSRSDPDLILFVETHYTQVNLLKTYDVGTGVFTVVYDPSLDTNGFDLTNPGFLGASNTLFILGSGYGSASDKILLFGGVYPSLTISSSHQNLDPASNYSGNRVTYYSTNSYYPYPAGSIYTEYSGGTWTENIYGFGDPSTGNVPGLWAFYSGKSDDEIFSLRSDLGWSATGLALYEFDGTLKSDLLGDAGTDWQWAYANHNWKGPQSEIIFRAEEVGHAGFGNNLFIALSTPSTVWVDDDWTGPGNSGGLAWGYNAFGNINDAMAVVTDGGTIHVAAGLYNEQVTLDRPLTLQGEDAATTVIDGTGLGQYSCVSITQVTGDVTLDGFTLQNADRFQLLLSGGDAGARITISNNFIIGHLDTGLEDYGLYGSNGEAEVLFTYNTVYNCTYHGFFLERWMGPSEVSYNDFTVGPEAGATATGHMTYRHTATETDPHDVTAKQWIHHNTIDANGNSGILFFSCFGWSYNDPAFADGSFTNVEISNNTITNVGNNYKGIQFETDGDTGGFFDALIMDNDLYAQNPGVGTSRGIRMLGKTVNTVIVNNTISGFYRAVYQSYSYGQPGAEGPSGMQVHNNQFIDNTYGVENQYTTAYHQVDATFNWWGDASGPYHPTSNPSGTGDEVTDNVLFDPWLDDTDYIAVPWQYPTIQAAIDAAAPSGDTIFVSSGDYTEQLFVDNKSVTLLGAGRNNTRVLSPDYLGVTFVGSKDYKCVVGVINGGELFMNSMTVDGQGLGNTNYSFIGVGYRNGGGTLVNCDIKNIQNTPFSGAQHGVAVYAWNDDGTDREVSVTQCGLPGYQKLGIVYNGQNVIGDVTGCTLAGIGPTAITAQNGIQYSSGARGRIDGCTVTGHCWTGGTWTAAGILLYSADTVDIANCPSIADNQTGVYYLTTNGTFYSNTLTAGINAQGEGGYYYGISVGTEDRNGQSPTVSPFGEVKTSMIRAPSKVIIADSVIDSDQTGYGLGIGAWIGENSKISVIDCEITDWNWGVAVPGDGFTLPTVTVYQSDIMGNTEYGVYNETTKAVDATYNYWGDPSGPYHPTLNPTGLGDPITDYVEFLPLQTGTESLLADRYTTYVSGGGLVNLSLDAGTVNGNRRYLVMGSLHGSYPGVPLPGGLAVLPINWDSFTDFALLRINTATFPNFLSYLDSTGKSWARVNMGVLNSKHIGKVMTYAYCLEGLPVWDFASNPIRVTLLP